MRRGSAWLRFPAAIITLIAALSDLGTAFSSPQTASPQPTRARRPESIVPSSDLDTSATGAHPFSDDGAAGVSRAIEAPEPASTVVFLWSGAISPTSVRVSARLAGDSTTVRLLVSTQPDLGGARVSGFHAAVEAANHRVVSITMKGLSPGTAYFYGIESDGATDPTKIGRFRTPVAGPLTFTLALGSCALTGSNHTVFDRIRTLDPYFLLHMGDFHYQNIDVDDRDVYRGAYDIVLSSPRQSALFRNVPIAYMWDDHDYGPNNGDATSPGRLSARLTYQEYVPHYPLAAGAGDVPIHQAFSIGRVRFIVTDSRSERTPYLDPDLPGKTMLGAAQKAWFEQQLLDANGVYPVIVWVNTLPWIGTTGDDGWYVYTHERAEIADVIADNAIQGLFMVSGDAHMIAIDDGTNSDYSTNGGAAFPVMHAAALDQGGSVKGGPYSHGAFPGGGQFGLMTVQDDGVSPVCVTWSGRNSLDQQLVGFQRCVPAPPVDTDADGIADTTDCAFADSSVWAAPSEVGNLLVSPGAGGTALLSWATQDGTAGPATAYDVVAGSAFALRPDQGFLQATCLAGGLADTPFVDGSAGPAPGGIRYYLVRAVNACGSGGYGHTGPADPRFVLDSDQPCAFP